jgi:hypothetical protein
LIAANIVVIFALVFFAARPTWVLGTSGSALGKSVGGDIFSEKFPCQHLEGSVWECTGPDPNLFSIASYRVTIDSLGCWTATRVGNAGKRGPTTQLSGCVTIRDYISD